MRLPSTHDKAAAGMLPAAAGVGLNAVIGDQPRAASSARPFSYAASRDASSASS
jgi:hypothetical protein